MRSNIYDYGELLIQSAKKKPKLQEMIDIYSSLSEEEINQLSIKPWIKKGLILNKTRNNLGHKDFIKEASIWADDVLKNTQKRQEDTIQYVVREAITTFFYDNYSIEKGDIFLITNEIFYLGEFMLELTNDDYINNSKTYSKMTIENYIIYRKKKYEY